MKVMFICTGNICRSAMAEGIFKKITEGKIEVYSCGTDATTGDMPTYYAIEAAKRYDVDITNHKATNIRNSRIKEMDFILCATQSHKETVIYLYPELKEKVFTIKEYARMDEKGQAPNIQDPWGYDRETYHTCCAEIQKCLCEIKKKIDL